MLSVVFLFNTLLMLYGMHIFCFYSERFFKKAGKYMGFTSVLYLIGAV